jgi:predicted nucleic acid-binding protein
MSQAVFADTWYYLAILNDDDPHHMVARAWPLHDRRPVVTAAWVVVEIADAMSLPRRRNIAHEFIRPLRHAPGVTVIPPDGGWLDRGLALFAARADKSWSLTDCISFEVMAAYGLTDALTGDRHFTQAGFNALFAPEAPT